jgi:hypothetical protein
MTTGSEIKTRRGPCRSAGLRRAKFRAKAREASRRTPKWAGWGCRVRARRIESWAATSQRQLQKRSQKRPAEAGRYKFTNQRNGEGEGEEPAGRRRCARRGWRCNVLRDAPGTMLPKIKNGRGNSAPAIFRCLIRIITVWLALCGACRFRLFPEWWWDLLSPDPSAAGTATDRSLRWRRRSGHRRPWPGG